jgi:hypothetical protein
LEISKASKKASRAMQVEWKYSDFSKGFGHGVEVLLMLDEHRGETLGFIDGWSWYHDKDPKVIVYLNQRLKEFPNTLTSELRLAILLFLTDKERQDFKARIHGFRFWANA